MLGWKQKPISTVNLMPTLLKMCALGEFHCVHNALTSPLSDSNKLEISSGQCLPTCPAC